MDVLENFGMSGRTFKLIYYGNIMLWGLVVSFLIIFIILELVRNSTDSQVLDTPETPDSFRLLVPDMKTILLWGYQGRGVKINVTRLFPGHLEEYEDGFTKFNLNKYLSDRISLRRPLPDVRDVECRKVNYDLRDLQSVSIVVVFRNEPRTTLLRMLFSVVDRSPLDIVEDIILVDDGTEMSDLQYPKLEHYLSGLKKVRIIRLMKTLGTAQARMHGARNATGDVVVFLQPRCECTEGWLLPLVSAVASDTIAVPLVDNIDYSTFQYSSTTLSDIVVGTFTWELGTRKRALTKPVENASMNILNPVAADGIFALTRDNLVRLGGFDVGLIQEQSVNIEFSFRSWLCGSQIVLVPCSHVGYITPRSSVQPAGVFSKEKIIDNLRIADKWMGNYRYFVYERMLQGEHAPKTAQTKPNYDASCQTFDWFLQKLEPNMSFTEEIYRRGSLVQVGSDNNLLSLGIMGDHIFMENWSTRSVTIWYHLKSGILATENKTCLSVIPRGNTTDELLETKYDLLDVNNNLEEIPMFMHQKHIESQLREAPAVRQQQEQLASKPLQSILFEREHQRNPPQLKTKANSHKHERSYTDSKLSLMHRQDSKMPWKRLMHDKTLLLDPVIRTRNLLNSISLDSDVSRSFSAASVSQNNLQEGSQVNALISQVDAGVLVADSLVLKPCESEDDGDRWSYIEEQALQHQASGLCLETQKDKSGNYLLSLAKCMHGNQAQQWSFVSNLMSF